MVPAVLWIADGFLDVSVSTVGSKGIGAQCMRVKHIAFDSVELDSGESWCKFGSALGRVRVHCGAGAHPFLPSFEDTFWTVGPTLPGLRLYVPHETLHWACVNLGVLPGSCFQVVSINLDARSRTTRMQQCNHISETHSALVV